MKILIIKATYIKHMLCARHCAKAETKEIFDYPIIVSGTILTCET